MLDTGLDTTQPVEFVYVVPPGASVLSLLVPGMVVGIFIDCRCIADRVEATRCVISAIPELFSEDKWVEF